MTSSDMPVGRTIDFSLFSSCMSCRLDTRYRIPEFLSFGFLMKIHEEKPKGEMESGTWVLTAATIAAGSMSYNRDFGQRQLHG